MGKKWYYRLVFSYLLILFTVVLLVCLLFFLIMTDALRKESRHANETYIKQVGQLLDNYLMSLDQLLTKEVFHEEVSRYIEDPKRFSDPYISYTLSNRLVDFVHGNPTVHSVYIYREEDALVMTNRGRMTLEEFGDRDFLRSLLENKNALTWTPVRDYWEEAGAEASAVPVVSLTRKISSRSGYFGYFVLNVRAETIRELLASMTTSNASRVSLLDASGVPIDPEELANEQGEFAAFHSDYTQWQVRSQLPDMHVLSSTAWVSALWLAALLVVMLFGAVWSLLVSRQNYKPVRSMVLQLERHAQNKSLGFDVQGKQDEFHLITDAIDRIVEQSISFRKQNEQDLIYRRAYYFQQLVENGKTLKREQWDADMERLLLPVRYVPLAVLVIEIDLLADFEERYDRRDRTLLKFALKSVIQELAQANRIDAWSEWTAPTRISALLQSAEPENLSGKVRAYSSELVSWVRANLPFTLTIGVGSVVESPEESVFSYGEAIELLNYKSVLGCDRLILADDILRPKARETESYRHVDLIRQVIQEFRNGHPAWRSSLEEVFASLRANLSSREDIVSLMNYMVYQFYRETTSMSAEYKQFYQNEVMPRLSECVESHELLDELQELMMQALNAAEERWEKLRNSSTRHAMILEIKRYIDRSFTDPNLSLTQIADEFKLTSNYLSQAFKEEIGAKFIDYVANIRTEEAKRLLLARREHAVHEIANLVGYSQVKTFIRTFKQLVGMTPGEYRKQRVESGEEEIQGG